MADARSERTLASLTDAILELAAEHPLSSITVSQLTIRAGINRATFYDHFRTPGELLEHVLNPDLDRMRERDNQLRAEGTLSTQEMFRIGLVGVTEHVHRFLPIYRLALPDPRDNVTHHILVSHFDESIRALLARRPPEQAALNPAVAARFMAHGLVGAIEAWLDDDALTPDVLVESVLLCAPAWWHEL